MRMWMKEAFVVFVLLGTVCLFKTGWREYLASAAVFFTFMYVQVSSRMQEAEAAREKPTVHCYKISMYYHYIKEVMWAALFISLKSWSSLVGVFILLLYPYWRSYYLNKYNKK